MEFYFTTRGQNNITKAHIKNKPYFCCPPPDWLICKNMCTKLYTDIITGHKTFQKASSPSVLTNVQMHSKIRLEILLMLFWVTFELFNSSLQILVLEFSVWVCSWKWQNLKWLQWQLFLKMIWKSEKHHVTHIGFNSVLR